MQLQYFENFWKKIILGGMKFFVWFGLGHDIFFSIFIGAPNFLDIMENPLRPGGSYSLWLLP